MVNRKALWNYLCLSRKSKILNRWTLQVYDQEVIAEYTLQQKQSSREMMVILSVIWAFAMILIIVLSAINYISWFIAIVATPMFLL